MVSMDMRELKAKYGLKNTHQAINRLIRENHPEGDAAIEEEHLATVAYNTARRERSKVQSDGQPQADSLAASRERLNAARVRRLAIENEVRKAVGMKLREA